MATAWDPKPSAGSSPAAGTAGNDFLAGLAEGPGSHEAAEKMKTAGNALKTLAQNGSFAVNEAGFNAYLKACDFFLSGYNQMAHDLAVLAQFAEMGSSQYAVLVAGFNVEVAAVGDDAMLPNLILMRDAVETAKEALAIARKNYREAESAHTQSFEQLNRKLDN
ncbi:MULTISPECIES: hypothetical protein [Amycolatopsis]|uniref:Uncharacterized protein n=1 Tax=Amycolatopsis albidoflavus TaxID=102226 RepID=A0ABW5HX71_9PSEU